MRSGPTEWSEDVIERDELLTKLTRQPLRVVSRDVVSANHMFTSSGRWNLVEILNLLLSGASRIRRKMLGASGAFHLVIWLRLQPAQGWGFDARFRRKALASPVTRYSARNTTFRSDMRTEAHLVNPVMISMKSLCKLVSLNTQIITGLWW